MGNTASSSEWKDIPPEFRPLSSKEKDYYQKIYKDVTHHLYGRRGSNVTWSDKIPPSIDFDLNAWKKVMRKSEKKLKDPTKRVLQKGDFNKTDGYLTWQPKNMLVSRFPVTPNFENRYMKQQRSSGGKRSYKKKNQRSRKTSRRKRSSRRKTR